MKKTSFTPKPNARPPAANLDEFVGVAASQASAEKLKRFTFDVTPNLHRRVKAGCAARGIEMADLMREFLEREFPDAKS
jgi:hypothetical protein